MYQIIYADPPWSYKDKNPRGGAHTHYLTTSTNDLSLLDVPAITAPNAVLFMWATMPLLTDAFNLMEAWGFKYKTCGFNWVKTNKDGSLFCGLGHHTRGNAELCLLGVRGKGLKRVDKTVRQTQLHPRGRHSAKPLAFRNDIERLYGINDTNQIPRLEMFARAAAPGWDVFGNEAPGSIEIPVRKPKPGTWAALDAEGVEEFLI